MFNGSMRTDGRVERGNQTRRAILGRCMQIASVEGLGGLSLGRVAAELNISKSGVFALFGSMEELQLASMLPGLGVGALRGSACSCLQQGGTGDQERCQHLAAEHAVGIEGAGGGLVEVLGGAAPLGGFD